MKKPELSPQPYPQNYQIEATSSLYIALFSVLFLVIFNYTLTMMGSLYIVGDLGGSNYTTTYTISFFSLGNALGVPLGRALAGHIGARRLLIFLLFAFAFFSFLSSRATNFVFFLTARFLQGLVSGPFYSILNRLFTYFAPAEKQSQITTIMLTIFTVGPTIGATWGGWIAYDYHWRYIFYINIPIILAIALFLAYKLRGWDLIESKSRWDGIGYLFFFISFFTLACVITTGQEFDWFRSKILLTLTLIGLPCLLFFILWSLKHPEPVIDFRLLKKGAVSFALFNLAILFSAYFGMIILLALWLSLYVNYTPIWIGVLLGTMAITGLIPTFSIMKCFARLDTRISLVIAIILLAISSFHTSQFNVDIDFHRIAVSRITAGFGLAFFLPPIFRLCFHSIEPGQTLKMVILFQVVRALSSGLGAPLYVILWQRREIFYHARLTEKLTDFSTLTSQFFDRISLFGIKGSMALSQLDYYVERQATSLALNDCFYFMGWILVVAGLVTLLSPFFRTVCFTPEQTEK